MQVEYHHWHSPALDRIMELKVYGHYGRPMLVFPSSEGRFFDYEGFGMIQACAPYIEQSRLKVFCVDGLDGETWLNRQVHPGRRGRRYQQYQHYLIDEVVPFIHHHCRNPGLPIIAHGCSLGAYHAANMFFRYPQVFDTTVLLSGIYGLSHAVGDYCDDTIYYNDPFQYLPSLTDEDILQCYRRNRIILACGQGRWEEECLADTRRLAQILNAKGVEHWLDLWGTDVDHEWGWWRKMMAYFLPRIPL